ncbi:succinate dehydrogenase cytochrome b subunit [Solicola sp. PLA-1-18]|uniref:succinate dehydrogenase cytochrome b subunit n=1 Tax=Solicola sp. PLA-1-18 TaxID=3380532 RepID=UPI003B7FF3A3
MATKTLSPRAQASRSTVALKALMAVSGLIMVGYLLIHMYGNLKFFQGQERFDSYLEGLRNIAYPYLPHGGALWILRVVLLSAVLAHAYSAVALWRRARTASARRGANRYHSNQNRRGVQRSYASFTLRWGGIIILAFIVFHVLHFTAGVLHPGGDTDSKFQAMVNSFSIWYVTLAYVVAILAVGFHLRHGLWSAFATLGANTSTKRRRHLNIFATVLAVVIAGGFLVPPLSIALFGYGS